jgi:hypothetical protein
MECLTHGSVNGIVITWKMHKHYASRVRGTSYTSCLKNHH